MANSSVSTTKSILHSELPIQGKEVPSSILSKLIRPTAKVAELPELSKSLSGDVAHDLRGQLTIIKGCAELMLEEASSTGQENPLQRGLCRKIIRACRAMNDLVENCLDFSRLESGNYFLEKKPVDLPALLKECVSDYQIRARAKGIKVSLEIEGEVEMINADIQSLERIFDNLLSNALKYSQNNSSVQVCARPSRAIKDFIEVAVIDHGMGIPEHEIPMLFEAFCRGSNRPTGGEKATGLGLAIVKRLVEIHQGYVRVDSKPGEGTTFIVTLPIDLPGMKDHVTQSTH